MKTELSDVESAFSVKADVLFDVVRGVLNLPLGEVVLFWMLAISISAAAVMKVRTRSGIMLGFLVSIASAVVLMGYLSAAGMEAKKAIERSGEERLSINKKMDRVNSNPSDSLAPDKLLSEYRKSLSENGELINKNSKIQELVTFFINFVVMTLGGLGTGLLASLLTSDKTAEDEVAIEKQRKMELINLFEYGVSFVFITTLLSVGYICLVIGDEVVLGFVSALVDGAITMFLGVLGFVWASSNIEFKRHKVLLLTGFVLLIGFFYVQFIKFFLHYQPTALVVCLIVGLFPYGKFRAFLRLRF